MIRILLVDDQTLISEILQSKLEIEENFQIVGQAKNGKEAIAQVITLKPDIVLMDIEMPEMDGLEATKNISNLFSQTKIIILSGNEDTAKRTAALKAGAYSYLRKNTTAKTLAHTIRTVHQQRTSATKPKLLKQIRINNSVAEANNNNQRLTTYDSMTQFSSNNIKSNAEISPKSIAVTEATNGKIHHQRKRTFFSLNWGAIFILIFSCLLFLNYRVSFKNSELSSDNDKNSEKSKSIPSSKLAKQKALSVATVEAILVDSYQEYRYYTGLISPRRTSELGFENSGQITKIAVEEGDKVLQNTPLAFLDNRELQATQNELLAERSQLVAKLRELETGPRAETIAAARASVRDLQEQLELAQVKSQRRKNLFVQGAISREQLDENVSSKLAIQARLDKAQSQLDELLAGTRPELVAAQKSAIAKTDARLEKLQVQQEKQILKAPFTATVSKRLVDEGAIVAANRPILRLVEDKALEARIGIPVAVATKILLGSYQKLEIGEKVYQAKVTALLPEVDSSSHTITAVLKLEQSGENVFLGQVARLNLTTNIATSGYWLPTTALVKGARGLWFCYALGQKIETVENIYKIERREVEVLSTKSDRVLVRGTVQPGDRIISNGTHRIVLDQLVRPVDKSAISNL